MRIAIYIASVLLLFVQSCTESQIESELPVSDLSEYNMKIIPVNPMSGEEIKLIILEDCQYNILSGVIIKDKIIDIEKRFNSMMKWPCVLRTDTINIGKLEAGSYKVNYKLTDTSSLVKEPIFFSVSFNLIVAK